MHSKHLMKVDLYYLYMVSIIILPQSTQTQGSTSLSFFLLVKPELQPLCQY